MTIFAAFGIFAEAEFRNPCDVQCGMQSDIRCRMLFDIRCDMQSDIRYIRCRMQSDIRCRMQSMLMQYAIHAI